MTPNASEQGLPVNPFRAASRWFWLTETSSNGLLRLKDMNLDGDPLNSFLCRYAAGVTLLLTATLNMHAGAKTTASAAVEKPNIVLLISDDHRWDGLGIAGNPEVQTPHLDQMAREGQWHRHFTIQVPSCSPSRAALLTGLPPYRNGWYSNEWQRKDVIDARGFDQYRLLPQVMREAGYHTAMTGKWHLTPDPWLVGFEAVRRWMLGGAGSYHNPRLAEGKSREIKVTEGFTQTIFADDAIDELRKRDTGETTNPLFLWVAFTAPHGPFVPNPETFKGMYEGKSPRQLAPKTFYDDPRKTKKGRQTWGNYYEAISALDSEVGRILDTIRSSDSLLTNTLVVFMGDNGFMMGRRDMYGKYVPYDDSLVVPMIAWGPERIVGARGTTVTASLNSLDLPPTFVRVAGGAVPPEWTGRDATSVLRDGKTHQFNYAVSSQPDHKSLIDHVEAYRVIRTPEYKLIEWHPETGQLAEFYDLVKDPAENTNLFGKTEVAAAQSTLKKLLDEYREKTGDKEWDMQAPLGMFEPERLKWKYEEGPKKPARVRQRMKQAPGAAPGS